MASRTFKPSGKYLAKLRLIITLIALLILAGGVLIVWLIDQDASARSDDMTVVYLGVVAIDFLWYLPALMLTGPYYRSLSYEIQDDEVIVRVGIWTHSVKHVPYRTVTNLTIKRGILDRWLFDLGTLNIQTAGMSGTTGAEESLEGLPNYQEVYGIVVRELQRFRGGMAPTAAEVASEGSEFARDAQLAHQTLDAILVELRAIRRRLEAE